MKSKHEKYILKTVCMICLIDVFLSLKNSLLFLDGAFGCVSIASVASIDEMGE